MQEVKAIQLSPGDTIYIVNYNRESIEEVILDRSNFKHSRKSYDTKIFDPSGLVPVDEDGAIIYFYEDGSAKKVSYYDAAHVFVRKDDAEKMLRHYKDFKRATSLEDLIKSFEVHIKKNEEWVIEYEFTIRHYVKGIPYFDRSKFLSIIKNNEYKVYARFMNSTTSKVQIEITPASESLSTIDRTWLDISLCANVCEPKETSSTTRYEVLEPIVAVNDDKSDSEADSTSAKIDLLSDDNGQISATASNVLSEPNSASLPPIELPIYK